MLGESSCLTGEWVALNKSLSRCFLPLLHTKRLRQIFHLAVYYEFSRRIAQLSRSNVTFQS